jgi:hypothetical protein
MSKQVNILIIHKIFNLSMVVHIYNPSYSEDKSRRIANSRPSWAKLVISSLKKKNQKGWRSGSSACLVCPLKL